MPVPAALIALAPILASAGVGIYGAASSAGAQRRVNEQNIKFSRDAMHQQRQWALDDWNMNNAYNSPLQQMQRFKEAGLNPHLIYGNANNSPASMVRQTDIKTPNIDAGGFINAANLATSTANDTMNAFFGMQKLQNETKLAEANILNLKANADKTSLDNRITREAFNELIMQPFYKNQETKAGIELTDRKRLTLPSQAMATERYLKETAKTDASAKHALELFRLAQKEGKLKQADIDTLETLQASPMGIKLIIEFLRMITK
ncbi:MAG: DNA pilot protein [Arizlama microvirus]|nr:MAG: DNA pilot protein [Arizlama microvirus]